MCFDGQQNTLTMFSHPRASLKRIVVDTVCDLVIVVGVKGLAEIPPRIKDREALGIFMAFELKCPFISGNITIACYEDRRNSKSIIRVDAFS